MRVICVDNKDLELTSNLMGLRNTIYTMNRKLTIGKLYEVIEIDDHLQLYLIQDDLGGVKSYSVERFVSIEEVRSEKLNKLGI